MVNSELKERLWVADTPLEVSGKYMEQGSAYIFFRSDDSFMIHQPLESIGGRWYAEKWFDFYRDKLDVRTGVTCILSPVSKIENHDTISGTYLIDNNTLEQIETATYKAFNMIMPVVEKIEKNILNFDYNIHRGVLDKDSRESFVISNEIKKEIEPGTCICSKFANGYMRLNKIKTKESWQISSDVQAYDSEEYSFIRGVKKMMTHMLNGRFVYIDDSKLPEQCKNKPEFRYSNYIIPSEIFNEFEKKYIEAVTEIQDIRFALLEIALDNHKKAYGEEVHKKAEEYVFRYLRESC